MDIQTLRKLNIDDLKAVVKNICPTYDIYKFEDNKEELLVFIIKALKNYVSNKYIKLKQIGNKGKDGITYIVRCLNNDKLYAMKTFKSAKSPAKIYNESELQHKASLYKIAPKVFEVNTFSKYIVMELMDTHLVDTLNETQGILSTDIQYQIVNILQTLDAIKIFHNDSNCLNYMIKNNKVLLIDYGMSKHIDDKLIKRLGTSQPNLKLMTLALCLKLKEMNCPPNSYKILLENVSSKNKLIFGF